MISLQNIEKSYPAGPARYYVLRRITIDIKEGDFITIMGPSGAGKSTLLSIIGMLDGAWSGEYYLLEQPVHKLNLKQRAELNKLEKQLREEEIVVSDADIHVKFLKSDDDGLFYLRLAPDALIMIESVAGVAAATWIRLRVACDDVELHPFGY